MKTLKRREFLKVGLFSSLFLAENARKELFAKTLGKRETSKKILILGFDGMDPNLLWIWVKEGKLPAFQKLMSEGDFKPLGTSIPPQSPVAWSNFITGMDPGGHGIFDFVHRDPESYIPIFSASSTEEPKKNIKLGNYVLPLSGGNVKLLRKGKAFWQILETYDIPATVFKIPSNYPPAETKQRTLSGMGTPDILGTYGIFNYYTDEPTEMKEDIGGGRIHEVYVIGNRVEARLPGPINTFKKDRPESYLDFKVFIDPENPLAKISIQDHEFILKEGEWSEWKRIRFEMIPTQSVSGICQFYLKQIRPSFKLYVSPINIDPAKPALPISTPEGYSKELARRFGPFFTKGLPADTKALDHDVLDEKEFLELDDFVLKERKEIFEYELSRFESGLLFYYVSSTDQRQHMFWRLIDRKHPLYDEKLAAQFGNTIENIYQEADKMLTKAMEKVDKNTLLMVISDHGFTPFRRCFNLNTWLKENGYLKLIQEWRQGETEFFQNTDWSRTKAYAYGINSLYINEQGREAEGIVKPGKEKDALVREIAEKLERVVDPLTGERVILNAYITKNVYHGPEAKNAPEIIIGYNRGYRASWATPLGRIPKPLFEDNRQKWSGDHCMDPSILAGILLTNQKIKREAPALHDLTATILKVFDIEIPQEMIGKPIF